MWLFPSYGNKTTYFFFMYVYFSFLILFLQVIGSITGVRFILDTFPQIGHGPSLNVGIHHGALTEGLLTFAIVTISLGLARKIPGSFYMKTWISSVSKLALHILGSDMTGGCMNPASVSTDYSYCIYLLLFSFCSSSSCNL